VAGRATPAQAGAGVGERAKAAALVPASGACPPGAGDGAGDGRGALGQPPPHAWGEDTQAAAETLEQLLCAARLPGAPRCPGSPNQAGEGRTRLKLEHDVQMLRCSLAWQACTRARRRVLLRGRLCGVGAARAAAARPDCSPAATGCAGAAAAPPGAAAAAPAGVRSSARVRARRGGRSPATDAPRSAPRGVLRRAARPAMAEGAELARVTTPGGAAQPPAGAPAEGRARRGSGSGRPPPASARAAASRAPSGRRRAASAGAAGERVSTPPTGASSTTLC